MITIHPQYIIDEKSQKQAVIISIDEWESIIEKLEMIDDIEAYDREKENPSEIIPFSQALKEIREEKGL
jgi:PHD/YefM family antitoxin component YafN of YafNO toxin-antitoxin module